MFILMFIISSIISYNLVSKNISNNKNERKYAKSYDVKHNNLKLDSRSYYLVFQNNAYNNEFKEKILKAPKYNKLGYKVYHWDNITKLKPNDLVFNVKNRKIVSYSRPIDKYFEKKIDDKIYYAIKMDYKTIKHPIKLDKYRENLLRLNPPKYAPFNKNGYENSGYLFKTSDNMGKFLEKLIEKY